MRRTLRFAGLALLAASGLLAADPKKPVKQAPPPVIGKVAWLAGSWRLEKAGRVVEEQWMAPAGGVMLGLGRTIAKGKMVEYEFTQIREGPGGELFFIAQPSGQKEAAFKVLTMADNAIVFENKEHDFPQTIGYTLQADGSLLAFVEGAAADGTTKRLDFAYTRVK
jgi:hypothetical protein